MSFVIPKISSNEPQRQPINPLRDEDIDAIGSTIPVKPGSRPDKDEKVKPKDDKILSEIDIEDMNRASNNPKLATMVKHIENLVQKTINARKELQSMMLTSVELKEQCLIQKKENEQIEENHKKIGEEMLELKGKVTTLNNEKVIIERKLEELKLENDELEAFLEVIVA